MKHMKLFEQFLLERDISMDLLKDTREFFERINEGQHEEDFKTMLFKALKDVNLNYSVESSPSQLKNGTIVIRIHDLDVLKSALTDRGITDDDINSQASLKRLYDQWEHPQINKQQKRDTGLAKYTIYSRGGIRLLSAPSDAYKFDSKTESGIKGAVDWLINHYSVWFIQVLSSNALKSDKFTSYKKGYNLDLSKVSQHINPVTLQFLERIKSDSQKKFEELAPSIMILCYLAHEKKTVVHASSGTNMERMQFDVTNDDIEEKVVFFVNQDWSVGIKNPTVKMTIKKSWYYIKNYTKSTVWIRQEAASATILASKSNFPGYQQAIIAKLLKTPDYNFDKLDSDYTGAKSGTKFGL